MTTIDLVLEQLEQHKGAFISGSALAAELGVSRNAIWKAIKGLEERGYAIEGVTRKGYRLAQDCNIFSAASIEHYLTAPDIAVEFHDCIGSTNTRAKELAAIGCPQGTLVVANQQTAGRGRQGRTFYSPAGTGAYFSFVLRPQFSLEDLALVTSYAAIATARALDEIFGCKAQIKWVNDIFVDGRKTVGILTEAAIQPETGGVDYAIVGIGINVAQSRDASLGEGKLPADVAGFARGSSSKGADEDDARARLVALTVNNFFAQLEDLPNAPHLAEYRSRSMLDGRTVHVQCGHDEFDARVLGINDDLTLQVQLKDGSQRALSHGEVHIPSSQF